ncbi:MAG: MBL fold metallo-hydrolase, partial [Deltaproteobacteria bacterium]|nr:MBL fold metallo-hydrolase [Deltaproteobacteria bacterium]
DGALNPWWFNKLAYVRQDFDPFLYPELNYRLFEGEYEVVRDIWVFPTPGHTKGHQSVFLKLDGGNYIITGDAIYTQENADTPCLPGLGLFVNPIWWSASMKDIMHKVKVEKATLLWMHDPIEFKTGKKPPEYYK